MNLNFSINSVCPNGSFYVIDYDSESLGDCFIKTCLLIPAYLVFAIINSYILGYSTDLSRHFKHVSIRLLRLIISLILLIIIISIFVKYFFSFDGNNTDDRNIITTELIIDCYQLVCFIIHTIILYNKSILYLYPTSLLISFILITIANFVNLINFIFINRHSIEIFNLNSFEKFNFFSLVLFNFFLFCYIFVLIISLSNNKCRIALLRTNKLNYSNIVEAKNEEDQSILESDEKKSESKSEEDKANYYSYLTFQWLKPIMVKGFKRQITKIEHLSILPIDLNVKTVCDRFMSKYVSKNSNKNFSEHQINPILNPDLLLDEEFMSQSDKEFESENLFTINFSKNNLSSALLRCFGRNFFVLGIFKLSNDIISFSGPLLLSQLVQFVETKDANLKDGCYYAIALFLTTLIGSIINIHFTNSLNKLCLRIKTALITLIYRKAVVVRLDQLNKYSTGQIVNYMSIDTDSVVNAFPSFHSFWSLPFQICITLYLLYSQIGISFVSIINFFPIYFYNKYCLYLF
jgi:ATP-binding cassette, subfamily C (CFTR/MRP), member 10